MVYNKIKLGYSSIIPFSRFYAINLFGTVIRRNKYKNTTLSQRVLNHELTHTLQSEDFISNPKNKKSLRVLGYCIFYIFYFLEWLIKCICSLFTLGKIKSYRSISFEQEAYDNEQDYNYPNKRKRFAWTKYIFNLVWK